MSNGECRSNTALLAPFLNSRTAAAQHGSSVPAQRQCASWAPPASSVCPIKLSTIVRQLTEKDLADTMPLLSSAPSRSISRPRVSALMLHTRDEGRGGF